MTDGVVAAVKTRGGDMKTTWMVSSSLVTALVLAGCASPGGPTPTPNPSDPLPAYHDPVVVRPAPDSPDVAALASGLNDVGYDLFHAVVAREDGDVVLSPLSIGMAFGMLDLGATDGVAQALDNLFSYPVSGDARWSAFNTLEQSLVSEPGPLAEGEPPAPIVRIADREFHDTDFAAVNGYDEQLMRWFGAGIEPVPFATDAEASRQHINAWVSDKTQGLIPNLLQPGAVNESTVMTLVNALYLKAQWLFPFDPEATEDADFTLLDGSTTTTPLMHEGHLTAAAVVADGYTAIDLPYGGDSLSMLVVAPDAGRYDEIQTELGSDFIAQVEGSLAYTLVDFYFPRFESAVTFDLRQALEDDLGVTGLFGVAELGGIGPGVVVDGAVHSARIKVDELGTEAAAATAIEMAGAAPPSEPLVIRVDHPFLYLIRDNVTGAVLFVGRVLDPSA